MKFSISSNAAKLFILLLWLFLTNPKRSDLLSSIKAASATSYFKNVAQYFGYTIKNYFTGDIHRDYKIFSFFNFRNKDSFYIGLSGFWLSSDFWMTASGTALLCNFVLNLILDHVYLFYCWFEVTVSTLFYSFISSQLTIVFKTSEHISYFLTASFVLSYVITNYGLYKFRLFVDRSNPSSHVYALASAALTFLACHQRTMHWNGLDVEYAHVVMALLMAQMLLGHGAGFAGSLSGFLLNYLQQTPHVLF